jgi:hypothetical protein
MLTADFFVLFLAVLAFKHRIFTRLSVAPGHVDFVTNIFKNARN